MANYNSRGFKQKGFTYPGKSPLKGKRKTADLAAAQEGLDAANDQMAEFSDMKMKSTNLTQDKGFAITGGGAPSPMKIIPKALQALPTPAAGGPSTLGSQGLASLAKGAANKPKGSGIGDKISKAANSEAGVAAISGVAGQLMDAGIQGMMSSGKSKPKTPKPNQKAFSSVKLGRG